MKMVTVFIKPNMYFKTKDALTEVGFVSMSTKEVLGRGRELLHTDDVVVNDNTENKDFYDTQMYAKKMIEIYVRDQDVDALINVIVKVNRTNNSGDGKIFVSEAEECIRIRTGEKGIESIM